MWSLEPKPDAQRSSQLGLVQRVHTKSRLSKTTWSTRVLRPLVLVTVEVIPWSVSFRVARNFEIGAVLEQVFSKVPDIYIIVFFWGVGLSGPLLVFRTDSLIRSSSDEARWPCAAR